MSEINENVEEHKSSEYFNRSNVNVGEMNKSL